MPKKIFVRDLTSHTPIDTSFFCRQKEIRKKKNGEDYLMMILSDKTGEIYAFVWEHCADFTDQFNTQDIIRVQGLVREYNGRLQLNVQKIEKVPDGQIAPEEYFPASREAPEAMVARLHGLIEAFEDPHIKALLREVFQDPEIAEKLPRVPAGKSFHHNFIGGLLEHTLSVFEMSRKAVDHYGSLHRELLLAGALLHDIGKVEELGVSRGFDYTDKGRLLGHIVIGVELVTRKMDRIPEFPPGLRMELLHMIISHHNELEHGSPKRPKTPEALVLTHLDDLDAKFEAMAGLIDAERHLGNRWTSYSQCFGRFIYKRPGPTAEGDEESAE